MDDMKVILLNSFNLDTPRGIFFRVIYRGLLHFPILLCTRPMNAHHSEHICSRKTLLNGIQINATSLPTTSTVTFPDELCASDFVSDSF